MLIEISYRIGFAIFRVREVGVDIFVPSLFVGGLQQYAISARLVIFIGNSLKLVAAYAVFINSAAREHPHHFAFVVGDVYCKNQFGSVGLFGRENPRALGERHYMGKSELLSGMLFKILVDGDSNVQSQGARHTVDVEIASV